MDSGQSLDVDYCVVRASTAVQQERGPRKNKGRRRRLHVTSRRDHGNLSAQSATVTAPHGTAVKRAGTIDVSPGETNGYRSAFTDVRRTARNTFADLVANSNSSNVTSQSASAADAFSRCKYRFVWLLNNLKFTIYTIELDRNYVMSSSYHGGCTVKQC